MKIEIKKPQNVIIAAGILLLVIIIALCSTSGWRARHSLKSECGTGMDCVCFSNFVDNRLSSKQVRAFLKYLNSVKRRPNTNILEFTDEVSAQGITQAVNLCRPTPVQPQQPADKQAKKK